MMDRMESGALAHTWHRVHTSCSAGQVHRVSRPSLLHIPVALLGKEKTFGAIFVVWAQKSPCLAIESGYTRTVVLD